MRAFVSLMLLFLFYVGSRAQDVSRAAIQLDFQNGYWIMDIHAGAAETSRALQASYPDKELTTMDIGAYNNLFLKYLLPKIEVTMDSQQVVFRQVNYGTNSTEAYAKLISPRFKTPQKDITIRLTAFAENEGHVTSVNAYDGNDVQQGMLSSENDFTTVLSFPE